MFFEQPYGVRLFVGALPYSASESDLWPIFARFGSILELIIQRDACGRSRGCAWLRYSSAEECQLCIDSLCGKYYLGDMSRALQIAFADQNILSPPAQHSPYTPNQPSPQTASIFPASVVVSLLKDAVPMNPEPLQPAMHVTPAMSNPPAPPGPDPVGLVLSGLPAECTLEIVTSALNKFGDLRSLLRAGPGTFIASYAFSQEADRARIAIDGAPCNCIYPTSDSLRNASPRRQNESKEITLEGLPERVKDAEVKSVLSILGRVTSVKLEERGKYRVQFATAEMALNAFRQGNSKFLFPSSWGDRIRMKH